MKPRFLVPIVLLCLLIYFAPQTARSATSPKIAAVLPPPPNVNKLLNMTKIQTLATPIGGNCYFPATVDLNVTWTGPNYYQIKIESFHLFITQRNLLISNSTASLLLAPNNVIGAFFLWNNVPVTLRLSFDTVCVSSVSLIILVYTDGRYTFSFSLP